MVLIRASRAFFCSSFKVLHFENRVRCSSVNSAGPFPSEKNCDKAIPNALHTASKAGSAGAFFLLNIFVTVERLVNDSLRNRCLNRRVRIGERTFCLTSDKKCRNPKRFQTFFTKSRRKFRRQDVRVDEISGSLTSRAWWTARKSRLRACSKSPDTPSEPAFFRPAASNMLGIHPVFLRFFPCRTKKFRPIQRTRRF